MGVGCTTLSIADTHDWNKTLFTKMMGHPPYNGVIGNFAANEFELSAKPTLQAQRDSFRIAGNTGTDVISSSG